ncbi:hypothetical protein SESBI_49121, partial [Sesbania bispinosa]
MNGASEEYLSEVDYVECDTETRLAKGLEDIPFSNENKNGCSNDDEDGSVAWSDESNHGEKD